MKYLLTQRELNLRHRRCLELIKDYDLVIDYHLGKANVVANALRQKSLVTLAHIRTTYVPLILDLKTLKVSLDCDYNGVLVASFVVNPTLVDQIRGKQVQDNELVKEMHKIMNRDIREIFWISQNEALMMKGRVFVLDINDLRKAIME